MVQGQIPKGFILKLQASESIGNGAGQLGLPLQKVTLNNQPVDIISQIGSCYTGNGVQNGHLLTYHLELEDPNTLYSQLSQEQSSINIVYTLTDDN